MARIVLDTDVVSRYRSGRLPASFARQVTANDISIAFATAGELWRWTLTRQWGGARRGGLGLWLDKTTVLPAGLSVAKAWGEITTAAQRRWRPRPFNHSWIAACCIEAGLPLLTLNRRLHRARRAGAPRRLSRVGGPVSSVGVQASSAGRCATRRQLHQISSGPIAGHHPAANPRH